MFMEFGKVNSYPSGELRQNFTERNCANLCQNRTIIERKTLRACPVFSTSLSPEGVCSIAAHPLPEKGVALPILDFFLEEVSSHLSSAFPDLIRAILPLLFVEFGLRSHGFFSGLPPR
jgi:hypothetical protein